MLGSSWDVSWHFRWLRDDLTPPHLLNSAGTAVVIGLVIFHSYTGTASTGARCGSCSGGSGRLVGIGSPPSLPPLVSAAAVELAVGDPGRVGFAVLWGAADLLPRGAWPARWRAPVSESASGA